MRHFRSETMARFAHFKNKFVLFPSLNTYLHIIFNIFLYGSYVSATDHHSYSNVYLNV